MKKSLPEMLDEEITHCPSAEEDSGFGALTTERGLSTAQGAGRAGAHRRPDRADNADTDVR